MKTILNNNIRVRFAPSPTGPLHIGGVRTALYNYLVAKKHGGSFILRIEDTDQQRYQEGAEAYIISSLKWAGLVPDESPETGGEYGPYRQSERRDIYKKYIQILLENGSAYYAFDTPEQLEEMRNKAVQAGEHSARYDYKQRPKMKNSISLSPYEVSHLLNEGVPYTVRLKVPEDEKVTFQDLIRGEVSFESNELDDKVLLKADGLPTYHFANVVDDYLMKISHVIRGEEWLSSTPHHVLLYRAFGWESEMPVFAHLPLILKPTGKGKLSKRDGAKFGMPVFPLSWEAENPEDSFTGFKEKGFLSEALINFLAFLGWNPGTEQEIFSLQALIEIFNMDNIVKSGARFNYEKALWFNQQYIIDSSTEKLLKEVKPLIEQAGYKHDDDYISSVIELMKERAQLLGDFITSSDFLLGDINLYDEKAIRKKWKEGSPEILIGVSETLSEQDNITQAIAADCIKSYINQNSLKFGEVLPVLRLAVSGTLKGPDVFGMIALLGKEETLNRITHARKIFPDFALKT
jgi:glutamyl-tRNA synthetase